MKIFYFVRAYNRYGPGATHGPVASFLEHMIVDDDFGLAELLVVANFATALPASETLEGIHETFHRWLASLPNVKHEARKRKLTIEFESKIGLAEDVLKNGPADPELFRAALNELNQVLDTLKRQLRSKPGLRFAGLVAAVARGRSLLPEAADSIVTLCELYDQERRIALVMMPWWEKFGIDWADYHANAKSLLDDPLFWNPTDDNAFDVLAGFKKWRPKNRRASALNFLDSLFQSWGIDDQAVQSLSRVTTGSWAHRDMHRVGGRSRTTKAPRF